IQNLQPGLIWTSKRDDIDYKSLARYQIVNHYEKTIPLTTKVGLCTSIKNLSWVQEIDSDTIFPRCFQLHMEEELQAFIDDFRLTAAVNILKWIIDPSINGKSSKANSKHSEKIHDAVVRYALQACENYIECQTHLDLDVATDLRSKLDDNKWNLLLSSYYQIIHQDIDFSNRDAFAEEAKNMLQSIKLLLPQFDIDGVRNVWIMKPAAKSRGRGIVCMDRLSNIIEYYQQCRESKWVIQKYIERPLLIYNTKFDIRQWFLVTDWNPLTVWIYKDSYLRFCTQQYTLNNLEEKIHLSNNAIQKKYSNGERSKYLPAENMWSSNKFKQYLRQHSHCNTWEEIIYPGMKEIISLVLQANQETISDYRKNSFELFGADFMLGEDFKPWLIEINSCPDLSASTSVTAELCASVINDTIKVIIDRKENKSCDIGEFELLVKKVRFQI
ncbi:uncharacterized protein TRIADDRAFT_33802, partial [Trichoplax adhaerens]